MENPVGEVTQARKGNEDDPGVPDPLVLQEVEVLVENLDHWDPMGILVALDQKDPWDQKVDWVPLGKVGIGVP